MSQYEPLDARIEYTLWYDNGHDDSGIVSFDNLDDVNQFMQSNNVSKQERYLGNIE